MQKILPILICLCFVAPAGAAKRVVVTSLPEPVRTSCAAILDEAGVPMSVRSSVYNVEAHLFRGKESDALVVANWTGEPQDVTLSLKDGSYRRAETFNSALVAGTSRDGIYELEVKGLPAGDCVRLLK